MGKKNVQANCIMKWAWQYNYQALASVMIVSYTIYKVCQMHLFIPSLSLIPSPH